MAPLDYQNEQYKVYSVISTFSDVGMEVYNNPDIPGMTYYDLISIANYYSIVLNIGQHTGALYGVLPVAYRTDVLLYLYTFEIINNAVKDPRVTIRNNKVPAFLLIFVPTILEKYATKAKEKIATAIEEWRKNFKTIVDITEKTLETLNGIISTILLKEQMRYEEQKFDEGKIVIGKSIQLLHNVSKYAEDSAKLLLFGTEQLTKFIKKIIFETNANLIRFFREKDNIIEFILNSKVHLKCIKIDDQIPMHRHISHDLSGVFLYDANFQQNSINNIDYILKHTEPKCVVTIVFSQEKIDVKNTNLSEVLQKHAGRTIGLIDLSSSNTNLDLAIIDFLEKVIENFKQ